MTLPLLSGLGAISVVIGLSYSNQNHLIYYSGTYIGILLIAISAFVSLKLSMPLFKLLGKTGIGVLNRIMGFFILVIAVQLVFNGIFSLTNH